MNLLKNKKHTETRKETAPLKMKRGQTVDLHWGDLRLCRRRSADRSQ